MKKFLKNHRIEDFKIGKWLPVFLWAGVIFFFSSLPVQRATEIYVTDFVVKKFAHISEYAILFALTFRAVEKKFQVAYIITVAYAVTDELHQLFVPGRTAQISDILIFDLAGINIAAYCLWKLQQIHRKKPKN